MSRITSLPTRSNMANGPMGHAEIVEGLVDFFDARAFFEEELGLAAVDVDHAVADEAGAVARDHAYLS